MDYEKLTFIELILMRREKTDISRNAFPEDRRIHRWDHKTNEDILTELQMSQITEFIYQI
jgi:hypothetical protein